MSSASATKAPSRPPGAPRGTPPSDALALYQAQDHPIPRCRGRHRTGCLCGNQQLPLPHRLYDQKPDRIPDEAASQLVARTFLHSRRSKDRPEFASTGGPTALPWMPWDGSPWMPMRSSSKESERRQSVFCSPGDFPAPRMFPRLVRLALATSGSNLTTSWNYLADAAQLDPRNTEVRSFRAQILEQIGKDELARVEYVAAHVAEPQNPLLRDQLAEFYRRQGNSIWRSPRGRPRYPLLPSTISG